MPEPDDTTNTTTNADDQTPDTSPKEEPSKEEPSQEEPSQEEPVKEADKAVEETESEEPKQEQPAEAESDVDIEDYWQKRYGQQSQAPVGSDNLLDKLNKLPTDEYGTADPQAVAELLQSELAQTQAEARRAAQEESMSLFQETAQQQQLMKKYPEVTKDRELLDMVFDLRDASAIKGQNISLMQAADRYFGKQAKAKSEGAKQATRTTQVQASAHLETSAVKSDEAISERQRLIETATKGSGKAATEARHKLMSQAVQNMLDKGDLKT